MQNEKYCKKKRNKKKENFDDIGLRTAVIKKKKNDNEKNYFYRI